MKFLSRLILIVICATLAQLFLPWWTIIPVCFIISTIVYSTGISAFLSGFLGVSLLWAAYAFEIDMRTQFILSSAIAKLMMLPNSQFLILITAIIGGLVAGFAAWSGHLLRDIFQKKKPLYY